mgnify:CR=1 FL=1
MASRYPELRLGFGVADTPDVERFPCPREAEYIRDARIWREVDGVGVVVVGGPEEEEEEEEEEMGSGSG